MRGAALNLSNMENFEAVTGLPYKGDEGEDSGPVVNSQRQLWSVAGYASMVQDIVFGLETTQSGIRFAPFVPNEIRNTLLAGADSQSTALQRKPDLRCLDTGSILWQYRRARCPQRKPKWR